MSLSLVSRESLTTALRAALKRSPVVAMLGPRQCGKTTLARQVAEASDADFIDLESPAGRRRLEHPMAALEPLRGLAVIDEAQLQPELFPVLRVLADRPRTPARFLLLGSASPDLVKGVSESLAGRVAFVDMSGFDLNEVGETEQRRLWLRGGFPRSFLAENDAASFAWREDFVRTFLERDIRMFGVNVPPDTLRRLWTMVAHYHGQIWNSSEVGRSLGEAHTTIKRHLDILSGAMMVRQLPPWFENLGKRQVKSPKVYVRDSGLLHALSGLPTQRAVEENPRLGASWEGFVVEEAVRLAGERNAYFWGTQAGAELDLLLLLGGKRYGVEVKYGDAPGMTKSMHTALADLKLERLWVVYPGRESFPLEKRVNLVSLGELRKALVGVLKS
ncbi:MAG: ATP-binding protein [Pedosphaera sp.]|nr:ATP-binding protein [Pedosphaera sp.]